MTDFKKQDFLNKNKFLQKGVALYLALLVLTVLLAIGLIITTLLVGQLRIIRGLGDSVIAFYAADTGVEKALSELYGGSCGIGYSCEYNGRIGNSDAYYSVKFFWRETDPLNCPPPNDYFCIKSTGIYQGVRRSIESSR